MRSKILIASHIYSTSAGPVYGPVDVICNYLDTKNRRYLLIKYPLISKLPLIIKSGIEITNSIARSLFYKPDFFIGIDPLNALSGIILKYLGLIKKTVFYSVDFTPTRFKDKLINAIYLKIDEFCARNSDEVWNVSMRIVNIRRTQGVKEDKIKFVPNSPNFSECPRLPINKIDRNSIIMVSGLTHSPVFDIVLKSFKNLSKRFPKLILSIVGDGGYQENLSRKIKKMGLSKNIKLLGQMPNKDLLRGISRSGLALALYTFSKKFSWVYYGDSKKAREYLACGTPVIITGVVGTSEDILKYKAGLVIKPNVKELTQAIEKLASDNDFWFESRRNAIRLGRDFDIERILDEVF